MNGNMRHKIVNEKDLQYIYMLKFRIHKYTQCQILNVYHNFIKPDIVVIKIIFCQTTGLLSESPQHKYVIKHLV